MSCAVQCCTNNRLNSVGKSFFRFPKNKKACAEWLQSIGRMDYIPSMSSIVCADHFNPSFICNGDIRKRLTNLAIPVHDISACEDCYTNVHYEEQPGSPDIVHKKTNSLNESAGKLSAHQKSVLIREVGKNYDVLERMFVSAQCKDKIWEEIVQKLNCCGAAKTTQQWKKCWTDMRLNVCKRFRLLTDERIRNGEGTVHPSFEFSADDNMILSICGEEYIVGDDKIEELGFGKNITEFQVKTEELASIREDEDAESFADANIPLSATREFQQEVQYQSERKRKSTTPTEGMSGKWKNYVKLGYEENCKTNNLLERLIEGQQNIIAAISAHTLAINELNATLKP